MKSKYLSFVMLVAVSSGLAEEQAKRPVDGIMDNSFLVEEAYNQESGVVQHIFNGAYGVDKLSGPDQNSFDSSFTQEWPVMSQAHQFSYTIPYSVAWDDTISENGIGDVLLNYRYQAYFDKTSLTAFAPRFSLVLPTGDDAKGFGNDVVGYQFNLPFSTTLNDRWFLHANAGFTFLPGVGSTTSHDVVNYNLGASAIFCVNDRFHLMLEMIGNWDESNSGTSWERDFSSVISPGMRYAFNLDSGAQLVTGLAAPIGLTKTAPDIGAFIYLSFEHRFLAEK